MKEMEGKEKRGKALNKVKEYLKKMHPFGLNKLDYLEYSEYPVELYNYIGSEGDHNTRMLVDQAIREIFGVDIKL